MRFKILYLRLEAINLSNNSVSYYLDRDFATVGYQDRDWLKSCQVL